VRRAGARVLLTSVTVGDATHGLDLAGVAANAVLGGVKAREHHFDIVGFVTLALVSGLGGGIIRDTLLQHGPPLALIDPSYLITAVAGAVVAYLIRIKGPVWEHSYRMVDALAIGCWAAAGAQRTLLVGLSWLTAILLGTITAVAGGVVRDVLLRDVPEILSGRRLYATSAVAASVVLVVCDQVGQAALGVIGAIVVGAGLCLLSFHRGWSLPRKAP
jgi:uncharacterized membrane protein YeiH